MSTSTSTSTRDASRNPSPAAVARRTPRLRGIPRTILFGALVTLVAIGGTFLLDPYRNYQLAIAAAYFCATAGLTLLIGLSGQLSLGHAALMAAGGYGYALSANAMTDAGVDGVPRFAVSLVAAVAASGALGLLLGLAAARLRGPYLAGLTLALMVALPATTAVFAGTLGGDMGLQIPYEGVPEALSRLIALEQWQAWIAILIAGAVVTTLVIIRRGRLGLRMRAVHAGEVGAALSGVSAAQVKVQAFAISAVAAGLGGAVLCIVTQSVSPGAYTLAFSLLLVVAVVIGGLGSIGGAAIGSALIVMLPWVINLVTGLLPIPTELDQRLSGNLTVLVFGALLIVVVAAWPGGIAGALARLRTRVRARRGGRERGRAKAIRPAEDGSAAFAPSSGISPPSGVSSSAAAPAAAADTLDPVPRTSTSTIHNER